MVGPVAESHTNELSVLSSKNELLEDFAVARMAEYVNSMDVHLSENGFNPIQAARVGSASGVHGNKVVFYNIYGLGRRVVFAGSLQSFEWVIGIIEFSFHDELEASEQECSVPV